MRKPRLIFGDGAEVEVEGFSVAGAGINLPDCFNDIQLGAHGVFILSPEGLRFIPYVRIETFSARLPNRKRGRPRMPLSEKSTMEVFEYIKRK